MYLYCTKQYEKDAEEQGQWQVFERCKRHEVPSALFAPIGGENLLCKRRGKYRHIAELQWVEGKPVLVFLRIYKREDPEYDMVRNDAAGYQQSVFRQLVDAPDLHEQVRKEAEKNGKPFRLPAPDGLIEFVSLPEWDFNRRLVYETRQWVEEMRKGHLTHDLAHLEELAREAVESDAPGESMFTDSCKRGSVAIDYAKIRLRDHPHEATVLLRPYKLGPSAEKVGSTTREMEDSLRAKLGLDAAPFAQATLDDLAKVCLRCYPEYALYDTKVWRGIELEVGLGEPGPTYHPNLALSAEEIGLLNDLMLSGLAREAESFSGFASEDDPHEAKLPLFIEGRAGSGKSTILLYEFAHYVARYEQSALRNNIPPPVFVTYNPNLLEDQRAILALILSKDPHFTGQPDLAGRDCGHIAARYMRSFPDLVRESLRHNFDPDEEFPPVRRIGFAGFRAMYKNLQRGDQEVSQISPELSWFVIRNLVKGYDPDELLDRASYNELHKRDRETISGDCFRFITDRIVPWYLIRCREERWWDDQDIARRAVTDGKPHSFSVVFFDEAQDLSRVELRLLFSWCGLLSYELPPQLSAVPIMLAGDPLQTLMPTGFRWKALRAAFYERVTSPLLGMSGRLHYLNHKVLTTNYRSAKPIARLCNLILFCRKHLYQAETDLQKEWVEDEALHPGVYVITRPQIWSELARTFEEENLIIVPPCDDGEEGDYQSNDSCLALIQRDSTDSHRGIMSPAMLKGAEHKSVVLYRFGAACPEGWDHPEELDESRRMEVEYFFNKLYVAATRATRYLYIVEDAEGWERLWQRLLNYYKDQCDKEPAARSKDLSDDVDRLGNADTFLDGPFYDVVGDFVNADPEETAKKLMALGKERGDCLLLDRAANWFDRAGRHNDAIRCRALARELDRCFERAGQLWLNLGMNSEALRCYWDGECWQSFTEHGSDEAGAAVQDRLHLARFMAASQTDVQAMLTFVEFLCSGDLSRFCGIPQWKKGASELARRLSHLRAESMLTEEWSEAGKVLLELYHLHLYAKEGPDLALVSGRCLLNAKQWLLVINAWDHIPAKPREYNEAKYHVTPYPQNLVWAHKLSWYDIIIEEWERHGATSEHQLGSEAADALLSALDARREYRKLFTWLRPDSRSTRGKQFLKSKSESQDFRDVLHAYLSLTRKMEELELPFWLVVDAFKMDTSGETSRQALDAILERSAYCLSRSKDQRPRSRDHRWMKAWLGRVKENPELLGALGFERCWRVFELSWRCDIAPHLQRLGEDGMKEAQELCASFVDSLSESDVAAAKKMKQDLERLEKERSDTPSRPPSETVFQLTEVRANSRLDRHKPICELEGLLVEFKAESGLLLFRTTDERQVRYDLNRRSLSGEFEHRSKSEDALTFCVKGSQWQCSIPLRQGSNSLLLLSKKSDVNQKIVRIELGLEAISSSS